MGKFTMEERTVRRGQVTAALRRIAAVHPPPYGAWRPEATGNVMNTTNADAFIVQDFDGMCFIVTVKSLVQQEASE